VHMTRTLTRRSDRCPACGRRETRSSEANRRYWQLVCRVSEGYTPDGRTFSPEVWHEQFKRHWLGKRDFTLPSGETISITRSTADLSTDEFSDFMTAVEAWANSRNVYLDE
jgi:hypothetical protein